MYGYRFSVLSGGSIQLYCKSVSCCKSIPVPATAWPFAVNMNSVSAALLTAGFVSRSIRLFVFTINRVVRDICKHVPSRPIHGVLPYNIFYFF